MDIVLKGRDGNPVTYSGADSVNVLLADGTTQTFATAKEASNLYIDNLDFSSAWNGEIWFMPESGQTFSGVYIKKPEMLVPSVISEGVNIAGIIGTLVASGGGSEIKIATGTFTGTTASCYHNLGVTPDVVIVYSESTASSSTNVANAMVGFSSKFGAKYPQLPKGFTSYLSYGMLQTLIYSNYIDATSSSIDGLRYANESYFMAGSTYTSSYKKFVSGKTKTWIAIAGLA